MASEKSRILVVGGTGYLGRHVVAASARLGHPTLALVRDTAPSDPAKAALLKGDLYDQASLVSRQGCRRGHLHAREVADRRPDKAHRCHQGGRQRQAVLPVGVRPGRRPHGHRGAGQVHPKRQGGHPPGHRGRGHPLHLRRRRLLRGLRAPQHRAAPRPRPAHGRGGRTSSATATPRWCSSTRRTSGPTRCWQPATRAPRTRRCTSSRRPTRCRTTSCSRCGRGRPARRSGGSTCPRKPCSSRSKSRRSR